MAFYDVFKADLGGLQLTVPAMGDIVRVEPLTGVEKKIQELCDQSLAQLGPCLEDLPAYQIEALLLELLIKMGMDGTSIQVVRRYIDDRGALISGKWGTNASSAVEVLVRIVFSQSYIGLGDLKQMLAGRPNVRHLLVIAPHTWIQETETRKAPASKTLVHFIDRVQLMALFARYGTGFCRRTVEIRAFDQGLLRREAGDASGHYSELLAASCVPDDVRCFASYWDLDNVDASDINVNACDCPEWPDIMECIDLEMPWPDAYLDHSDYVEEDSELLLTSDEENVWILPDYPEVNDVCDELSVDNEDEGEEDDDPVWYRFSVPTFYRASYQLRATTLPRGQTRRSGLREGDAPEDLFEEY